MSISALDIFASSLGVFVLTSIMIFPNYLKEPSVEVERAGALSELAAARQGVSETEEGLERAREREVGAKAALAEARQRLQRAQATAAATPGPELAAPPAPRTAPGEQKIRLAIADLDLVFVMDTTGSMRRELQELQANLIGVIRVLHRLAASLRIGFVAFKDRGDAYLTRVFALRPMEGANVDAIVDFVRQLSAQGGGDDPEPVDEALRAAIQMLWRNDAQGRIVVIGDAPSHPSEIEATFALAARFEHSSPGPAAPRTVSAIYTGGGSERAFFERLAAAGGGEMSVHQGQMFESVLLSVLEPPASGQARR